MTAKSDVLVVGFGAVGATYAMIMQKSGLARVSAVARSNHQAIQKDGIHIKSIRFGDIPGWKPDRLYSSLAEAAQHPYKYIVLTTKAIPELAKTPTLLAPFLTESYAKAHPQPVFVLMQNGLNVEVDLYNALKDMGKGEPKIISTAVWIGVNMLENNVVEHSAPERMAIGMYQERSSARTTTPEDEATLKEFASFVNDGGSVAEIVPVIAAIKFMKNCWNCSYAAICTLTGFPLPSIFRKPPGEGESYTLFINSVTAQAIEKYTIPNVIGVLKELLTLGRALGFTEEELPSSMVESTFENTKKLHIVPTSTHRPSMLLDAENGKPFEVEVIVGECVRMAQQLNVDIPRIEMLYALLLVMQNQILGQTQSKQ